MDLRYFLSLIFCCFLSTSLLAQEAQLLNANINTPQEEREPKISPDGNTMYFWRRSYSQNTGGLRDPGDIWISRKIRGGAWMPAQRAPQPLNSIGHDFVWHISTTGDTLWLNQHRVTSRAAGIYYTYKTRRGWSQPRPGRIRGFRYSGNYKDFHLGPNGIMLLPNEGENSFGGTDLYVSFPINDTTWSKPVNLGPTINTAGDDDAPFLSSDGRTLYFNSNGRDGEGDHDIYYSTRLDNSWQKWSEPQSIGYPINTSAYDFDFIISPDNQYAYWCSSNGTYGNNDIYRMSLNTCSLDVYPEGDQVICEGESIELEAGFSLAKGVRYQWKKDGVRIAGATERRLTVNEPGTYQLIRFMDDCVSEAEPKRVTIVSPPIADVSSIGNVICLDDSVRLRTRLQYGANYQWQKNGLDIPGENRAVYYVKNPGVYRLVVSNGSCEARSKDFNIRRFDQPRITKEPTVKDRVSLRIPKWDWVNRLEPQKGMESPVGLAVDQDGGTFVMSLIEDKRGRVSEQITKYFPEGPFRMHFPVRRKAGKDARFMTADKEGNLFVARTDELLVKYREDGRLLWSISQSVKQPLGVATDELGYAYVAGRYGDGFRIEGEYLPPFKRGGLFIAKFTPYGDKVWVKSFPVDNGGDHAGNALYADCGGNIYLSGSFETIANFRDQILRNPSKSSSHFIVKFSGGGELIWAKKYFTDKMGIQNTDLFTDCNGNSYLLLNYSIIKLDRNANQVYRHTLKAPGLPLKARIAANELGELFILGHTKDKGQSFMTKLGRTGSQVLLWGGKWGTKAPYAEPLIARDPRGSMFIAGVGAGDVPPATPLAIKGKSNSFIAKYGKPKLSLKPQAIELCDANPLRLYVNQEEGINYQWLLNGEPIPNATGTSILVSEAGEYQVSASAELCERFSPIQRVLNCEDNTEPTSESIKEPVVVATKTPVVPKNNELQKDKRGKPLRLRRRPVRKQGEFVVENPLIKLYVWDHGADDNDTISLSINGRWLLEDFRLTKKRKELEVQLNEATDYNYIILFAKNLGSVPPNTATIMIDDGFTQQTSRLRSNLNSNGAIRLRLGDTAARRPD